MSNKSVLNNLFTYFATYFMFVAYFGCSKLNITVC